MSRVRTRPTREETRARLIEAALECFVEIGIGATSIEDVCDRAGLTRGAFYSNFESKDDLVIAVLDQHVEAQLAEMDRLLAAAPDMTSFLLSLEGPERRLDGPHADRITLHMELVLFALRSSRNRRPVAELWRRWEQQTEAVIGRMAEATGAALPVPLAAAARLVTALDQGYSLRELVMPGDTPEGEFSTNLAVLLDLWVRASAPAPPTPPARAARSPRSKRTSR